MPGVTPRCHLSSRGIVHWPLFYNSPQGFRERRPIQRYLLAWNTMWPPCTLEREAILLLSEVCRIENAVQIWPIKQGEGGGVNV